MEFRDSYYGQKCAYIFEGSALSQETEKEFRDKYPEYTVKEIGYQGETGYVYRLAVFPKTSFSEIKKKYGIKNEQVFAEAFGLSLDSWKNTSARERYITAIEKLHELFIN